MYNTYIIPFSSRIFFVEKFVWAPDPFQSCTGLGSKVTMTPYSSANLCRMYRATQRSSPALTPTEGPTWNSHCEGITSALVPEIGTPAYRQHLKGNKVSNVIQVNNNKVYVLIYFMVFWYVPVVSLNKISGEYFVGSNTAVVWSLWWGETAWGPAEGPQVWIQEDVLLFNSEPWLLIFALLVCL